MTDGRCQKISLLQKCHKIWLPSLSSLIHSKHTGSLSQEALVRSVSQNFSKIVTNTSRQQQRPLTALGCRVLERSLRRVAAERPGICRWWPIRGSWSWPVSAPAAPPAAPRSATCLCHGGEPHPPPTIPSSPEQMFSIFCLRTLYLSCLFVQFIR